MAEDKTKWKENWKGGQILFPNVLATVSMIVGANPKRTFLVFFPNLTAHYFIGPDDGTTVNRGIMVPSASAIPVVLCSCQYGSLVTKEVWAISAGGTITPAVIEITEG